MKHKRMLSWMLSFVIGCALLTGCQNTPEETVPLMPDNTTVTQELSATCEENNTGLVIGIVVGLVVLAVIAVFLLKQHKK